MDTRLTSLESSIEMSLTKVSDVQNELKLAVQAAAAKIGPIEATVSSKVSQEQHNALLYRVTKLEDAPQGVKSWLNMGLAAAGCLISFVVSLLSIVLGVVYFLYSNHVIGPR